MTAITPGGRNQAAYDAIATRWDAAPRPLSDSALELIDHLLVPARPGELILDLGCGTGNPIAELLVSRAYRVSGVDQSAGMLAIARRRLPREDWVQATLETWQPPGQYAGAIAWDSLFHIPREAHAGILRRVRACLSPGARLLFTSGGSANSAFTDDMFDETFFYDAHPPHTTLALVRECGFTIMHHTVLNPPTGGRDKGRIAVLAEVPSLR